MDKIPDTSEIRPYVDKYCYMGNLGENYSILNRVLPCTYRVWRAPAEIYDALIIVTHAHPITVNDDESVENI